MAQSLVDATPDKLPAQKPSPIPNVVTIVAPACVADGLYDAAERLLVGVRDRFGGPEGEKQLSWQRCLMQLGDLRVSQKRYAEAEEIYDRVEQLRTKYFGPADAETIGVEHQRALLQIEQGNVAEGERLAQQALDRLRESGHADHQHAATCRNTLGWLALKDGDYDVAAEQLLAALVTCDRAGVGRDVARVREPMENLEQVADAYGEEGQPEKAERLLAEIIGRRLALEGPTSAATLGARLKLFEAVVAQGKLEQAVTLARQLVGEGAELATTVPVEMAARVSLGLLTAYEGAGRLEEALGAAREALRLLPEGDGRRTRAEAAVEWLEKAAPKGEPEGGSRSP